MPEVVASEKGYFGGMIREAGERFSIPDDIWNDEQRRPSWVERQGAARSEPVEPVASAGPLQIDLDNLKVPELKAYAEQAGIDLGAATKKADILAVIRGDAARPGQVFDDAPEPVRVENSIADALGTIEPDWVQPGSSGPRLADD